MTLKHYTGFAERNPVSFAYEDAMPAFQIEAVRSVTTDTDTAMQFVANVSQMRQVANRKIFLPPSDTEPLLQSISKTLNSAPVTELEKLVTNSLCTVLMRRSSPECAIDEIPRELATYVCGSCVLNQYCQVSLV